MSLSWPKSANSSEPLWILRTLSNEVIPIGADSGSSSETDALKNNSMMQPATGLNLGLDQKEQLSNSQEPSDLSAYWDSDKEYNQMTNLKASETDDSAYKNHISEIGKCCKRCSEFIPMHVPKDEASQEIENCCTSCYGHIVPDNISSEW